MKQKQLSGEEKAALLLIGLDKEVATQLLSQLSDDELRKVMAAYNRVEDRSFDAVNKVFGEFCGAIQGPPLLPASSDDYFKKLMTDAVGETRSKKLFVDQEPRGRWDLLKQLEPKMVAAILVNEHPQAVAALLYQMDENIAGPVLKALPKEMVSEIVRRVGSLQAVPEEAIREIEQVLALTLGEPTTTPAPLDGVQKAATLVNFLDPDLANEVVDAVAASDTKVGDQIRKARFTMEDLMKGDTKGLQQVLREVASDRLLLALRTVTQSLRDKLLGCVSSRVADSIRDELSNMGPTKLSDVEAAQKEIIDVALRLQRDGKLQIEGQGGGGEAMV